MPRFAEQQLYISGQYVAASSGETFDSINPATGEVLAKVQCASQADAPRGGQRRRGAKGVGGDDRHAALAHPAQGRRHPPCAQR